jgi:DNA-binding transcriptional ArsR family regulator
MAIDRRSAEVWASWFKCLADPSRVLLLNRLAEARRPMTVGELVAEVDIRQPTVSHHLRTLSDVGFVRCEPKANATLWSVNERCLERFPSAAELILGVLPRYEPHDLECVPPWQEEHKVSRRTRSTRTRRAGTSSVRA